MSGIGQIILTEDYIFGKTKKLTDDEEVKRNEWIETFRDCIDLLEPLVFTELVCNELQGLCSSTPKWDSIEACLYTLHIVIPFLSDTESTYIPQIMTLITSIPIIPGIQHTLIELIGSCSHWLNANPSHTIPLLNKLITTLNVQEHSSASAIAIMKILKRSRSVTSLPMVELNNVVLALRSANTLSLEADLYLIEGMCTVISKYSPELHTNSLREIIDPIYKAIAASLDASIISIDKKGNQICANIDKLTCVMRYTDVDRTLLASTFVGIQPLLETTLDAYTSERVAEKVCRCYKHLIKSCRAAFLPFLPAMASYLSARFQKAPYPAFLYVGSSCLSEFAATSNADRNATLGTLYQMLIVMSREFFQKFGFSLTQFEEQPNVVEEYFFMMAKALRMCPEFLALPEVGIGNTLVRAGVIGLGLNHREAQKGILYFFEEMIRLRLKTDIHPTLLPIVTDLVLQVGTPLIHTILLALSGQLPFYAIEESGGSVHDLLWNLKRLPDASLQTWLVSGYSSALPWVQEEMDKSSFIERILSVNQGDDYAREEFSVVLDNFVSRCCRR